MPNELTLITTPSISYARSTRFGSHVSQYASTSSIPLHSLQSLEARNCSCCKACRDSECLGNGSSPSTNRWYAKNSNLLCAVIEGSSTLTDPAAAFLGFTKILPPFCSCCRFIAS